MFRRLSDRIYNGISNALRVEPLVNVQAEESFSAEPEFVANDPVPVVKSDIDFSFNLNIKEKLKDLTLVKDQLAFDSDNFEAEQVNDHNDLTVSDGDKDLQFLISLGDMRTQLSFQNEHTRPERRRRPEPEDRVDYGESDLNRIFAVVDRKSVAVTVEHENRLADVELDTDMPVHDNGESDWHRIMSTVDRVPATVQAECEYGLSDHAIDEEAILHDNAVHDYGRITAVVQRIPTITTHKNDYKHDSIDYDDEYINDHGEHDFNRFAGLMERRPPAKNESHDYAADHAVSSSHNIDDFGHVDYQNLRATLESTPAVVLTTHSEYSEADELKSEHVFVTIDHSASDRQIFASTIERSPVTLLADGEHGQYDEYVAAANAIVSSADKYRVVDVVTTDVAVEKEWEEGVMPMVKGVVQEEN